MNVTILELTHINGLYYLIGTITGYGTSYLLLDTNTPALLARSQSSVINPQEIDIDSDSMRYLIF